MEKLIKILENPFANIKQNNAVEINTRCKNIAQMLFDNYCIKCGNKYFRFAEIEFYYYKKEKSGNENDTNVINFDAEWNKETYPRNKNAGELFFHYSGVDICFQSHFDDSKKENEDFGEFGGILIRSILDGDKILAGPLFCANAMLNACKEHLPKLMPADYKKNVLGDNTTRSGIDSDKKQKEGCKFLLCCYATQVDETRLDWTRTAEKISWNTDKGLFIRTTRNYKYDRFKE